MAERSAGLKPDLKNAWAGQLPARFSTYSDELMTLAHPSLKAGCRILDVGAGRSPLFPVDQRPVDCTYVGLDISQVEIEKAPPGSYDDFAVGNVCEPIERLQERFDLVVSWQLLEHVKSLDDALHNIHTYLKPGGLFLGQLSGTFSFFALAGRVLPSSLSKMVLRVAQRRDPTTVFPAYYHHCWSTAMHKILSEWSEVEVTPRFMGAAYLTRWRTLMTVNEGYEQWAMRRGHDNLATHYLISARR